MQAYVDGTNGKTRGKVRERSCGFSLESNYAVHYEIKILTGVADVYDWFKSEGAVRSKIRCAKFSFAKLHSNHTQKIRPVPKFKNETLHSSFNSIFHSQSYL